MISRFMKLLVISIVTVTGCYGQTFEGRIVYANNHKSKMANVSDQQFSSMMGNTQEYFIKGGSYKTTTNGTLLQWQLYINKDNKLYNKMSNSPTIFWNDGAANADEVIKSELNKNAMEILGYKCDELILTCKSGIQKYYFSNKLKVDPKLYINHKFGNWSEYISKSGSLPLKILIDNAQFTLECIATEVKAMTLSDKLFELPTGSKVEKSPY